MNAYNSAKLDQIKQMRHTVGHFNCPACMSTDQMLTVVDADFSGLTFSEVVPIWKAIRKQRAKLKDRTHERNDEYLTALSVFFGAIKLNQISPGHIREYQIARGKNCLLQGDLELNPWSKPAANSIINHEISVLGQMLKRCNLWQKIKPYYNPLHVASWSPRDALSEEEEEQLFRVAAQHSEVSLAYWVAAITNNTSAAGCELRGLRLEHIFLRDPVFDKYGNDVNPSEIYIPPEAVKNNNRPRKIPLNSTAKWAVQQCVKRALKLGSVRPEHYLFPFRLKINCYDPMRPPSRWWIRDNFEKLRDLAGLPHLRPHDLRHQCITRMLEAGVEPETVRAVAGHVNQKMMEYYSHIRRQAKFAAVSAIEPGSFNVRKPATSVRIMPPRPGVRKRRTG